MLPNDKIYTICGLQVSAKKVIIKWVVWGGSLRCKIYAFFERLERKMSGVMLGKTMAKLVLKITQKIRLAVFQTLLFAERRELVDLLAI